MAKMKVHELAKELNVPSRDVIAFLEGSSIEVKSHMSVLEEDMVSLVRSHYRKKSAPEKAWEFSRASAVAAGS